FNENFANQAASGPLARSASASALPHGSVHNERSGGFDDIRGNSQPVVSAAEALTGGDAHGNDNEDAQEEHASNITLALDSLENTLRPEDAPDSTLYTTALEAVIVAISASLADENSIPTEDDEHIRRLNDSIANAPSNVENLVAQAEEAVKRLQARQAAWFKFLEENVATIRSSRGRGLNQSRSNSLHVASISPRTVRGQNDSAARINYARGAVRENFHRSTDYLFNNTRTSSFTRGSVDMSGRSVLTSSRGNISQNHEHSINDSGVSRGGGGGGGDETFDQSLRATRSAVKYYGRKAEKYFDQARRQL
uniref:Uncharacterized protein n=1 Tax=Panagrolaimus sp. ES5 TaxID=591445 RepID=A0AC34GEC8_9BILA